MQRPADEREHVAAVRCRGGVLEPKPSRLAPQRHLGARHQCASADLELVDVWQFLLDGALLVHGAKIGRSVLLTAWANGPQVTRRPPDRSRGAFLPLGYQR